MNIARRLLFLAVIGGSIAASAYAPWWILAPETFWQRFVAVWLGLGSGVAGVIPGCLAWLVVTDPRGLLEMIEKVWPRGSNAE